MIEYNDADHTYKIANRPLISVTTFLSTLTKKFQTDYWATYKVMKFRKTQVLSHSTEGVPELHFKIKRNSKPFHYTELLKDPIINIEVQRMKESWEDISKTALKNGSEKHDMMERAWLGETVKSETINRYVNSKRDILRPVKLEEIVYDEEAGIAGRFDGLFYNMKLEEYELHDNKTDVKIERENRFESFLPPIDHIPATNYWKHALQLNIYRHCIELNFNIKLNRMFIVQMIEPNIVQHQVPMLDKEIKLLLDDNRRSNSNT